ncbi:flavodoxin domain-containing protein [Embleya sp. AB8]|uniref:flavodoxin domain-containing protein n=1 Tax=Embleya sp. AB8 TaxID=3156304 RepID=UPI003C7084DA
MNILVTYASAHGSTRGVAHRIGDRLRGHGLSVRVEPVSGVEDLSGFDACVLGSAIHGGSWLPAAVAFADERRAEFGDRPVWLFDVGLARAIGGGFERHAGTPESVTALSAVAQVRNYHRFAGALARSDLPRSGRLFFRLARGRYGDFRDWAEIEAWADTIADALVTGAPAPEGIP